jgi:acyl dehydratase
MIEAQVDRTARRWAVGDELPPLEIGEITKAVIAEYSRVSNDFNPMHTDEEFAKAAGYPGVFAQGMLGMAYLARHLGAIAGPGKIQRIKTRFKTMTWPGERITCKGRVTEVKTEGGRRLVCCEIQTENHDGEPKVVGTAAFWEDA